MASTEAKIGLAVVVAASVTTALVLQHQTISRLESEIRGLRAQLATAPPSQSSPGDTAELGRLRGEHEELMRLRGQVAALRQQAANPPKVQKESEPAEPARSVQESAQVEPARSVQLERYQKAMALLAESPESFPMIWSTNWGNAGLATPAAAYQTMKWATANRDMDTLLATSGMDPKTREMEEERFSHLPEAVRAKHGSLDALLIDLYWKNTTQSPSGPTGLRILSQYEDGPDDVTLVVQEQSADGRVGGGWTRLYRDENGSWRFVVPPLPQAVWAGLASGGQPPKGPLPVTQ